MSGYSTKALEDKLGIRPNFSVVILNAPTGYLSHFKWSKTLTENLDFIQYFTHSKSDLQKEFPNLKKSLKKEGMLWVSWPKGTSGVETDLNENKVMEIGLKNGLVDIKVASIDEIYSGLKFVYRLKDR